MTKMTTTARTTYDTRTPEYAEASRLARLAYEATLTGGTAPQAKATTAAEALRMCR